MANREKGGRVVFIGNIPYGVSEEQICDIFARIGQVLSFRLVYDKETGKPKGFGFLEYGDVDAAASAVRNLNGHEIMGRELKVDYSNDNSGGKREHGAGGHDGGSGRAPPPAHFQMSLGNGGAPQQGQGDGGLPQLPPGVPLDPGFSAPDAISRTLNALPPAQLLDILSQMKTLSVQDPTKATQLLSAAPQLGYAIFQALLLLGLVDPNTIGSLIQQQSLPVQPPPQPQQPPPQHLPPYQQPPPSQYPPNPYQQPPPQQQQQYPGYPPQPQQHPGYMPTPPQPQPAYQPPPQQAPPPAAGGDPQAQLIQQVLAMSREEIYRLDEVPRNQILQLRSQLGAPVS